MTQPRGYTSPQAVCDYLGLVIPAAGLIASFSGSTPGTVTATLVLPISESALGVGGFVGVDAGTENYETVVVTAVTIVGQTVTAFTGTFANAHGADCGYFVSPFSPEQSAMEQRYELAAENWINDWTQQSWNDLPVAGEIAQLLLPGFGFGDATRTLTVKHKPVVNSSGTISAVSAIGSATVTLTPPAPAGSVLVGQPLTVDSQTGNTEIVVPTAIGVSGSTVTGFTAVFTKTHLATADYNTVAIQGRSWQVGEVWEPLAYGTDCELVDPANGIISFIAGWEDQYVKLAYIPENPPPALVAQAATTIVGHTCKLNLFPSRLDVDDAKLDQQTALTYTSGAVVCAIPEIALTWLEPQGRMPVWG